MAAFHCKSSSFVFVVSLTMLIYVTSSAEILPEPCDSQIYCQGELLHTIQMANLFNDSKYFVDMTLVHSPNETLKLFKRFMAEHKQSPTKEQLLNFVRMNFNKPGSEFEDWEPQDWQPKPKFLKKIVDPTLEKWAEALNGLWKELGRKISPVVKNDPEKYSQLYVPNPVIVPGGRFGEFYYWDSYWTMEGLLLSGMSSTVKGMLENFVEMVRQYGMVPNGGRVYYTRRSQPPYLIPMFKLYLDHTKDYDFIRENVDVLDKEFQFWVKNRMDFVKDLTGKVHGVFQYNAKVGGPRPESYKEDYEIAHNLSTEAERDKLYVEFKSGAESGWDYSTRWFVVGDTNIGGLSDLNVTAIAPVDLNSLMCHNAKLLSEFFSLAGNETKSKEYEEYLNERNQTMAEVFWDKEDGIWYDVNIHTGKKRRFFYLSNIHPIWGGCFGMEGSKQETMGKVIGYLKKENVVDFIGGVPTSMKNSSQQWDFPNAWAPLQHIAIMGLYEGRNLSDDAEPLAFELAEKWVRTNWKGYEESNPNAMFEKYDVKEEGLRGDGGEYDVQIGFGWTNGVAMKFLDLFGDRLTATTGGGTGSSTKGISSLMLLSSLIVFLLTARNLNSQI